MVWGWSKANLNLHPEHIPLYLCRSQYSVGTENPFQCLVHFSFHHCHVAATVTSEEGERSFTIGNPQ